MKKANIFLGSL
jgi:hypothetical protein